MLGDGIHGMLHFLIGAAVVSLLLYGKCGSRRELVIVFLFGGIAGVFPDVTKLFGDLYGHSLMSAPLMGLSVALGFRILMRKVPFLQAWGAFAAAVIIGHIFIDLIGNGVAPFYPFEKSEYDFHIISRLDVVMLLTLLATAVVFFITCRRAIVLSGVMIICIYLGILSVSKVQLEQLLHTEYSENDIELLITYPRSGAWGGWDFQLRTDETWINGHSPVLGRDVHIESERDVET
ncbi:metal-dependent hydrolase [Halobacillus sp. A5]|uniref:metal-dependent hydrolase n=1 Tax=Halobacillus sp. A5 TaxID=2880263 RepID=UPI0020A6AFEC|nr:metal-dependent hydrolase [Halobacillus sp. A5]MCP3027109.1 metal-dependent hydrolase [Halobacillus sp. A5]